MSIIDNLIATTTVQQAKQRVLDAMQAAGLKVTSWIVGSASEQWFQVYAFVLYAVGLIVRDSNRAHFLEEASDPGDLDDQEPKAGWLSAKGEADYGTPRVGSTFATGYITFTNGGLSTHTLSPETSTLQNSVTDKTYRNTADSSIYTGAGGTYVLTPGDAVTVPIRAEEEGTASNAAPGEINILVTTLLGVTVSNANPVLGTDREPRDAYIAKCRLAAAATSPNGPGAAYEYVARNTNTDGTLAGPGDGKTRVNVTRVQVTRNSSTGVVRVWLASPSGAATSEDVTACETTIRKYALPDCVTLYVAAATEVPVTVTGNLVADAAPGLVASTIETAAEDAMVAFFATIPIAGFDGFLYANKIAGVAVQSHPSTYSCDLDDPSADVALSDGEVPTLEVNTFSAVLQ